VVRWFSGIVTLVALVAILPGHRAWAQDATLEILSTTDGATVYVDGDEVATTPMIDPLEVTEGGHLIRVERRGFIPYEELIVFFEGDEMVLEVDLLPFAGIVRIVTDEAGATVSIDGEPAGLTPYEGEVPVGERTFTVSRDMYEDWTTTAVIAAGEEYYFEADLIPRTDLETEIIIEETTPFYREWWFWTGTAVVIGGAVAAAVLLSQDEEAPPVDVLIELP